MTRLQILMVAVGLVASAGCKSDDSKRASHAAEKVVDTQDDLKDTRKDLGDKKIDEIDKTKDVVKKSGDLAEATADFNARRLVRVDALRAEHSVIATQPL